MNLRKYTTLIIGGSICLVLVLLALVMLVRYRQGYRRVKSNLDARIERLDALNRRDPFPSLENVEGATRNAEELEAFFASLLEALRHSQIEPEQMEAAEFQPLVERTVRELLRRARLLKVELPERFAFGFGRYYIEGDLPAPAGIPRLVVQLKAVDKVFKMLFETKISEVTSFTRQEFEQETAVTAGGPATDGKPPAMDDRSRRRLAGRAGRGRTREEKPEPSTSVRKRKRGQQELYAKEHFEIKFSARESAVWDLLNRMARSQMLVVVTRMEMETKTGSTATSSGASRSSGASGLAGASRLLSGASSGRERIGPLSHDERVVAGHEEVEVILALDVYRFLVGVREEAER